jgi:hypothetical protein
MPQIRKVTAFLLCVILAATAFGADTTANITNATLGNAASVTALKGMFPPKGNTARTSGYYAAGDGGGATYYFDANDNATADNGGSVLAPTNGASGRWKLVVVDQVNVRQFGAKGDGSADDTAAIRAADAAMTTAGGGTIYFPPGTYKVTPDGATFRVFTPTHGNTWRGQSKESSILKLANSAGKYVGFICDGGTNDLTGLTVENLKFDCNATNNAIVSGDVATLSTYPRSLVAIYNSSAGSRITFRNCWAVDIDDFIPISIQSNGSDIRITNNRFEVSGGSVAHDHSTINTLASSVWITGNKFVGNPTHNTSVATAIETHGATQHVMDNEVSDYWVGGNLTGIATGNRSIIWSGNHFINCGDGIQLWSLSASWAGVPYADLHIDGTTNTIVTSAAQPFTAANVDDVLNVTGGTGFTQQRVRILSVDATGKATCDVAVGTVGSTAGTGKLWSGLKDVEITDNEISIGHKTWAPLIGLGTNNGIYLQSADLPIRKLWILRNRITFTSIGTITTGQSLDFGIMLTSAGGIPITDLRIEDNSIANTVSGGIWLNMKGLITAASISRNHFQNIGQGAGTIADAYMTAVFPTGDFVDTVMDANTILDDQASHTIRCAMEGRYFTSATNVHVTGTLLRIVDGTVIPPYYGNATVSVHQAHVVNTFSNPGGLSDAGSQIIETSTGVIRYQTVAPSGNTWSTGGLAASTTVAPASGTAATFSLSATGNAGASYNVSCGNGAGGQASFFWKDNSTLKWQQYLNTGDIHMYLRDLTNSRMQVTYTPGASASTAVTEFGSQVIADDRMTAKTYVGTIATPTYGATVTIDASAGSTQKLTVTDGNAFTMAAPTNPVSGERMSIRIVNSSGGAMGTVTWNAAFRQDSSYANPANGKQRTAMFEYDSTDTKWEIVGTWSGDQ